LFSGSYNDLTNKPTIPSAYTLPTATDTILGGVKIGSNITINAGIISVAAPFSGSYNDLTNKPDIPTTVTVNGPAITLGSSGTVTADANTLTGTTLNSTVVTSSLTSVGTLGSLTVTNTITGSITGSVVWVNPTPAPGDPYRTAISAASGSAGISLSTGLPGLGSTVNWTFDTTKITFPDTTTQTTAYTGTATSAATLTTARNINGVAFNGSSAINIPTLTDGTNLIKITAVPSALTGASGDVVGSVAFDSTYIYYCCQAFTGNSYSLPILSSGGLIQVTVNAGNSQTRIAIVAAFAATPAGWSYGGAPVTNITGSN
jgi:hypothetical protein